MLPTIFETAPINYISPRIDNNDNLVPSPSFKELLSSSSRKKKIDNNNNIMDPTGGGEREITVEGEKVYIPTRRVFDDHDDDDGDERSSSMTTVLTVLQIDLDDVPDLPFCPADIMPSEQDEVEDDDADDDINASCNNDINFVARQPPCPRRTILRSSSTTPTDTSLSLLQRQQQNDQVRKQARESLLYSSSSKRSPRSVTNVLHLSSENSAARLREMTQDVQNILASRPAAA